jgi:glyceraldehyde-3-phosphate dehydrogenase (NADP+)
VVEVAKTPKEARDEIIRSAELIDYTVTAAGELADFELKSEDFPGAPAGRVQTVTRVPVGTVVAIGPFNYPINLSVSKIAPALLMGNTVIFKPPTQGSVAAARMVELFREAGIGPELLGFVTGKGSEIGDHLSGHPAVNLIAMTGSTGAGQKIAENAGMIPLMLELGGNDPAIVLADANLDLAAEHIAGGAFKYAGQRCTAVKRVYADKLIATDLVKKIVGQVTDRFGTSGDPRQHPVGPVISDTQADYLQELFDDAKGKGTVAHGGGRDGRAWEATVISGLPHTARLVAEEQFGPLLPIVPVKNEQEAVKFANDSEYGLQASIFSTDTARAETLASQIEAGGVHINGPDQRGPDNFMFVGHKRSGITAQGVRFALEAMSQYKGIVHNPTP